MSSAEVHSRATGGPCSVEVLQRHEHVLTATLFLVVCGMQRARSAFEEKPCGDRGCALTKSAGSKQLDLLRSHGQFHLGAPPE